MRKECWIIIVAVLLLLPPAVSRAAVPDWERAVSLYRQGQFREAISEFERVLAESPDHADSLKFIGLAWFQLRSPEQALDPLRRALEVKQREGRRDPELIRALGQALIALARYDESLPYLETITRLEPANAASHYLLGVALASLNRPAEALIALRRSLELNPRDGDTWHYIASSQFQAGQIREAAATLRKGLAVVPGNVEMLGLLAESLLRLGTGEPDERLAQANFEEAIRTAGARRNILDDMVSAELLGRSYLAAKRYSQAEQLLSRAYELTDSPAAILCFNLGFTLARLKSWPRAAALLAQANQLAPDDINTLSYLGYVYENLRRYPAAREAYARAWELGGRQNQELKTSLERVSGVLPTP